MLKGYIIDLEEDNIPFVINDEEIIIITSHNPFEWRTFKTTMKKIVNGILSDGRTIRFFNCQFGGNWFTAQGYVYAYGNLEPDPLEDFSEISFTGGAIDNLCGGVFGTFDREEPMFIAERMTSITPRPWDTITHRYKSEIAGQHCEIKIDNFISYNLRWGERQIGTCTPRFSVSFKKPVNIECILDIYLGVYDFFAFLNFRQSITFDSIVLYAKNERDKSNKIADVIIYSKYKGLKRKSHFESVILNDLGDNLGVLFSKIASRRKAKIFDNLFIPKDESDYLSISHVSFLACALSFEGEYDREGYTKEKTNKNFGEVKQFAYDSVISSASIITGIEEADIHSALLDGFEEQLTRRIDKLTDEKSKAKQRKIIGYAQKMIKELKRVDFSLEEQFNNMLNMYSGIIDPYRKALATRMEIDLQKDTNLGRVFSEFRNQIGHGHPIPISEVHTYVFVICRCLTYIMILKSAGLEDKQVERIFGKLFR